MSEKAFHAALEAVSGAGRDQSFDLAVIFGSGLGLISGAVEPLCSHAYADLGVFPAPGVPGHEGRLEVCRFDDRGLLLFYGRHHLYEGLSAWEATVNVRFAAALGCRRLLITNAVGSVNPAITPGDILFVVDHLNLMGDNPLRGRPEAFMDLGSLYQAGLFHALHDHAADHQISLHQGVLAGVMGPSYETPAEVRMLRMLGADVVGMSAVPEAIMAKYLDMQVATLSFVTNMAGGGEGAPLEHAGVLREARRKQEDFSRLVMFLARNW